MAADFPRKPRVFELRFPSNYAKPPTSELAIAKLRIADFLCGACEDPETIPANSLITGVSAWAKLPEVSVAWAIRDLTEIGLLDVRMIGNCRLDSDALNGRELGRAAMRRHNRSIKRTPTRTSKATLSFEEAEIVPLRAHSEWHRAHDEQSRAQILQGTCSTSQSSADAIKAELRTIIEQVHNLVNSYFGIPRPPWITQTSPVETLDRLRTPIQNVLVKLHKASVVRRNLQSLYDVLFVPPLDDLGKETIADQLLEARAAVQQLAADLVDLDYPVPESAWHAASIRRIVRQGEKERHTANALPNLVREATETNVQPERKTEKAKKTLVKAPRNTDVIVLAKRIKRQYGATAKTKKEIALDFTECNPKRAENFLRQIRNFPYLLD